MTTAPTLDYTGATVRVPYVGIGVVKEQVGSRYAVDIPIGSVNMRVWRESQDLKVIALVVKTQPAVTPDKPDLPRIDSGTVDSTLTPLDGVLSPQKGENPNDPKSELIRDADDLHRIQVLVKHLSTGDVIEHVRLDLHRPYDTELMHIVSITPHVALEPRIATVAVFRGKQGNWTSCGFCDVTFPTLTVAPFWTVCGGSKLDAARRDPALLERTNMMTLPRWKGGGDVMRLPMLTNADYGVLKGAA